MGSGTGGPSNWEDVGIVGAGETLRASGSDGRRVCRSAWQSWRLSVHVPRDLRDPLCSLSAVRRLA